MKFKFVGGNLALDFVNTVGDHIGARPRDYLKNYDDLLSWAVTAEIYGDAEQKRLRKVATLDTAKAARTLKKAIGLREILFRMLLARISGKGYPAALTEEFNKKYLAEVLNHLRLAQTKGKSSFGWNDGKDSLDQVIWIITWSATNLLVNEDLKFLKLCADNDCGWLFLDTSKNKRRSWCDMKDCGNRNKVRRFYSKIRSETT